MKYNTKTVASLLNVSQSTIKNYTAEFGAYLSPSASPPAGGVRQFTDDDLLVLSLAAQMKKAGASYDEIHLALRNGQRGEIPAESAEITPSASAMIISLREQIIRRDDIIQQLQLERAGDKSLIANLEQKLEAAQLEIRRLDRKLARLLPDDD